MRKAFEMGREIRNAKFAAFLQKPRASGGGADAHAAGIARIVGDVDQATAGESGDDAAHGRGLDLLSRSEFAQGLGATKNQDGERGEAGRAFSGSDILLADASQQVDGGRVETVSDGPGVRRRGLG
jgi:hypothetical protein